MNMAKYPVICLTTKENPRENFNREIDPTMNQTRTHCMRGNDVTFQFTYVYI